MLIFNLKTTSNSKTSNLKILKQKTQQPKKILNPQNNPTHYKQLPFKRKKLPLPKKVFPGSEAKKLPIKQFKIRTLPFLQINWHLLWAKAIVNPIRKQDQRKNQLVRRSVFVGARLLRSNKSSVHGTPQNAQ